MYGKVEPQQPAKHDWLPFRLGRMCWQCSLVQANDEFDDALVCQARPRVPEAITRGLTSRDGGLTPSSEHTAATR